MRKFYFRIFVSLLLILISCQFTGEKENGSQVEKIIFDTDMGPDYDDIGAVAVLYSLADRGECEILATVSSNSHRTVAPTIEAINCYFGKPGVLVGVPDSGAVDISASNHWNDSLLTRFAPDLLSKRVYPSASSVYRKILALQPDNSVTIVTVGFVTNLANLLKTEGDDYSPLSGVELVKKKVKKWVAMAGVFPEGREFNVYCDSVSSCYVLEHWPTPVLFSGFEIGVSIMTGSRLAKFGSSENPLAWAYRYNLASHDIVPVENRMSWDLTAVLCAVRNPERYFYVCGPGKFAVDSAGYNRWEAATDARHYFLVHKYPYRQIADSLEDLMMYEPEKIK